MVLQEGRLFSLSADSEQVSLPRLSLDATGYAVAGTVSDDSSGNCEMGRRPSTVKEDNENGDEVSSENLPGNANLTAYQDSLMKLLKRRVMVGSMTFRIPMNSFFILGIPKVQLDRNRPFWFDRPSLFLDDEGKNMSLCWAYVLFLPCSLLEWYTRALSWPQMDCIYWVEDR